MSDYEPIPKQLLNQEARCERCEELCKAFDMIRCACGTFRCVKCSLKKCDCQLEKCIHNEPARNCGICEDIHALQNRVDALEAAIKVMAQELATWRSMPHLDHIEGSYWADVANEHLMMIGGYLVDENTIAKQAVDAAVDALDGIDPMGRKDTQ